MGAVAHFCGCSSQLARDLGAALGEAGNDGAFIAQLLGIAVRIPEHHGRDSRLKPVALRTVARREPQRLDRHHVAAVQRHQPMGGAHELHAAPAGEFAVGLQLVGHDLGNGKLGDGLVQRLLQPLLQRSAGQHAVVEQGLGLAVLRALEKSDRSSRVRYLHAQGLQLFQQRRRGGASGVQPHADGHELLAHGLVGGLVGHGRHLRGQAARRGERREHRIRGRQALGLELLTQHAGKGIAQFLQRFGGQLFDEELDE